MTRQAYQYPSFLMHLAFIVTCLVSFCFVCCSREHVTENKSCQTYEAVVDEYGSAKPPAGPKLKAYYIIYSRTTGSRKFGHWNDVLTIRMYFILPQRCKLTLLTLSGTPSNVSISTMFDGGCWFIEFIDVVGLQSGGNTK